MAMQVFRGKLRLVSMASALAATVAVCASLALDPAEAVGEGGSSRSNTVRFATFNASLSPFAPGGLVAQLGNPDDPQARAIAEIIQRANPDVLLLNEFNFDENTGDTSAALELFRENFLEVSQNGAPPIHFDHVYLAPSNTGVDSGFDLDNNGALGEFNDAFGFGAFPGHFGMVLLSKYPILDRKVRTFQTFLWKDMPGALLPDDPDTPEPADYYSPEELEVLRLSSKSHWDVPIRIGRQVVHVLASHPTPPVFDGPEDRNGRRNADEIRFWSDYVRPLRGRYIVDDQGRRGGLRFTAPFVILGDLNADPFDGDSTGAPARRLLRNPLINRQETPSSAGGVEAAEIQGGANETHLGNPAFDTADFADETPGNLRVDYALPSLHLKIKKAGVFWPTSEDPLSALLSASDHRLVYVDLRVRRSIFHGRRRYAGDRD